MNILEVFQKNPEVFQIFWNKVNIPEDKEACWEWKACKDKDGYGITSSKVLGFKHIKASQLAFIIYNGFITPGMCILHSCNNRACCNPLHLREGTFGDNALDRMRNPNVPGLTPEERKGVKCLARFNLYSQRKLAEIFGITQGQISRIINNHHRT